jgi:hypothetical protein
MPKRLSPAYALVQLTKHQQPFVELFKHGSLVVEIKEK